MPPKRRSKRLSKFVNALSFEAIPSAELEKKIDPPNDLNVDLPPPLHISDDGSISLNGNNLSNDNNLSNGNNLSNDNNLSNGNNLSNDNLSNGNNLSNADTPTLSPYDDIVTSHLSSLPNYINKDRLTSCYIFDLSKFDYATVIDQINFNDESYVKELSWKDFNRQTTVMMKTFYSELSQYYEYGLSSKFRRNFCAALSSRLPHCEKQYRRIRKKSAKGQLSPDLSKHIKSLSSYSDLLFRRFEMNSRYEVKKLVKKNAKKNIS